MTTTNSEERGWEEEYRERFGCPYDWDYAYGEVESFIREVEKRAREEVVRGMVRILDEMDFGLVTRGKSEVIASVKHKLKKRLLGFFLTPQEDITKNK